MADIERMVEHYRNMGYSERNADARVCQDIILKAISKSGLSNNITVKGGVVMRGITGDERRATEDIDLEEAENTQACEEYIDRVVLENIYSIWY